MQLWLYGQIQDLEVGFSVLGNTWKGAAPSPALNAWSRAGSAEEPARGQCQQPERPGKDQQGREQDKPGEEHAESHD